MYRSLFQRMVALATLLAMGGSLIDTGAAQGRSIRGEWRGRATVVTGPPRSFRLVLRITAVRVGGPAGSLSYPGSPCRGALRYVRRSGAVHVLSYRESSRSSDCSPSDRIEVRLRRDGRLAWRATDPRGRVATATLRRA